MVWRLAIAAAFVSSLAAQTPAIRRAPSIPLREGLTIVRAYHNASGDYEAITTVTRVDAAGVTVAVSTDEAADTCAGRPPGRRGRSTGLRTILREDLEQAHALRQQFAACPPAPELHPGTTAISVSSAVLRELQGEGRTTFSAMTSAAGMVSGVLTRIETGNVAVRAIVNDEPLDLPALHARWQSRVGAPEYWILDDLANPLVLRGIFNGQPFLEVVKIAYPQDRSGHTVRMTRDLANTGRAIVYGIYFDFGSDRIKEESEPVLADIARVMQENAAWSLAVEGHTDNIGGEAHNLELSKRRADAVREALATRYHVDQKRLQTSGYGASRPKDTNATIEGRARNRRVELVRLP